MKVSMNKLNKKKANKKLSNDNPSIVSPQIDKISLTIDMNDVEYFKLLYSCILALVEENEFGVIKAKGTSRYPLAIKVYYPDENGVINLNGHFVLIQVTSTKHPKLQMRIEYNPYHLNEKAEEHLDIIMMSISGLTFYEMLFQGKVTRIDICIGILFSDISDYLFKQKWGKYSQCVFGKDGQIGCIYLGKSEGDQIRIYNKSKQLHGVDVETSTIRVEASVKPNIKLEDIYKIKNPFRNLEIYSLKCNNPTIEPYVWKYFQYSCRLMGVSSALKIAPPKVRSKFSKALSSYEPINANLWGDDGCMWNELFIDALDSAGLLNKPDFIPPLSYKFNIGNYSHSDKPKTQ